MSRIIKGAIYGDEPHKVSPPVFASTSAVGEEQISDEVKEHLLSSIKEKEQKAERLYNEARMALEIARQQAKDAAAVILQEAEGKAETMCQEAKERGYEEGFSLGRQEGFQKLQEEEKDILTKASERAEALLQKARELERNIFLEGEEQIVELVLAIADKALPRHFIDVPQVILPLIQEAVELVKDQPEVTVKIPPDNYEFVLMAQDELQGLLVGGSKLMIVTDSSLKPGECMVESTNGIVDAGIYTQLEAIKTAVREVMG